MRYVILTILLIIISQQKADASRFKVNALAGFAHHYTEYSGYNDRTFKNNLTSDVALLSLSYDSISLIGIADSQGNASFATIGTIEAHKNHWLTFNFIVGLYFLRTDNEPNIFDARLSNTLPTIGIGSREFTILPLIGVELGIPLNDTFSINTTVTMSFVLTGIKINF